MIRLIRFLFTGDWHLHKWEVIEQLTATRMNDSQALIRVQKCSECGKLQEFRIG